MEPLVQCQVSQVSMRVARENQLEHQEVHGSHIAEAWLGEF